MAVEFKLPDVFIGGDYIGEIEENNGRHVACFIRANIYDPYSVGLNSEQLRAIADKLEELEREERK